MCGYGILSYHLGKSEASSFLVLFLDYRPLGKIMISNVRLCGSTLRMIEKQTNIFSQRTFYNYCDHHQRNDDLLKKTLAF